MQVRLVVYTRACMHTHTLSLSHTHTCAHNRFKWICSTISDLLFFTLVSFFFFPMRCDVMQCDVYDVFCHSVRLFVCIANPERLVACRIAYTFTWLVCILSVSFHHLLRDLQHINAVCVFENVYAASQPVVAMFFSLVLNFLLRFVVFCVAPLPFEFAFAFRSFHMHIIIMFSAREYSMNRLYMEIVRPY